MKRTVYIPDETAARLADRGFNLNKLAQEATDRKVKRLDRAETNPKAKVKAISVSVLSPDGVAFIGRFRGTLLVKGEVFSVFLTEKNQILRYDRMRKKYLYVMPSLMKALLPKREYVAVMNALGEPPIIDI